MFTVKTVESDGTVYVDAYDNEHTAGQAIFRQLQNEQIREIDILISDKPGINAASNTRSQAVTRGVR